MSFPVAILTYFAGFLGMFVYLANALFKGVRNEHAIIVGLSAQLGRKGTIRGLTLCVLIASLLWFVGAVLGVLFYATIFVFKMLPSRWFDTKDDDDDDDDGLPQEA